MLEGLIQLDDFPGDLVREHLSGGSALHCHSCGTFSEGRSIIGSPGYLERDGKRLLRMNDMKEKAAASKCADGRSGEED